MKNEKKDALLKILIRIADKFVGQHLSDFTKKKRKVNKK
jgi:hypothetical protein